jgi:hypothetical protein
MTRLFMWYLSKYINYLFDYVIYVLHLHHNILRQLYLSCFLSTILIYRSHVEDVRMDGE